MAVRKTLQIGDPRLKAPNKTVNNYKAIKIRQIVKDMVDTMRKNGLVGLAAPQIGENYQIIISEPKKTETRPADQTDELRVYINPKITLYSKKTYNAFEGCGSVANKDLFGPVIRPSKVVVEAYDKIGQKFQMTCDGLLARVIQHEYDHLSGIEFIEKISDYRRLYNFEFYKKFIKGTSNEVKSSKITVKEYKKL